MRTPSLPIVFAPSSSFSVCVCVCVFSSSCTYVYTHISSIQTAIHVHIFVTGIGTHHSIRRTTVRRVSAHIPGGESVQASRRTTGSSLRKDEAAINVGDVTPTTSATDHTNARTHARTYTTIRRTRIDFTRGHRKWRFTSWYATATAAATARSHTRTDGCMYVHSVTRSLALARGLRWLPHYAAPLGPWLDCDERHRAAPPLIIAVAGSLNRDRLIVMFFLYFLN